MRVLLLIDDSLPAGKSGGRYHYGPGFVEVPAEVAMAWLAAGAALHVPDAGGSVHGSHGLPLCGAYSRDEIAPGVVHSCVLPAGHKGARHYDYEGSGKRGKDLGAGWWERTLESAGFIERTREASAVVLAPAPPASSRPAEHESEG